MGTNTFEQGPNPNGTQSADGFYHPEDEVFLPVVHAHRAEHRLGADADPVDEHRPLHADGRPQPVPGLPPAGDGLLGRVASNCFAERPGKPGLSAKGSSCSASASRESKSFGPGAVALGSNRCVVITRPRDSPFTQP